MLTLPLVSTKCSCRKTASLEHFQNVELSIQEHPTPGVTQKKCTTCSKQLFHHQPYNVRASSKIKHFNCIDTASKSTQKKFLCIEKWDFDSI